MLSETVFIQKQRLPMAAHDNGQQKPSDMAAARTAAQT
jgi:hypothetical protein